jgi:hypothetical protein
LAVALFAMGLTFGLSSGGPPTNQDAQQGRYRIETEPKGYFEKLTDPITIFTFFIMGFTGLLCWVAYKQWRDSRIIQRAHISVEIGGLNPIIGIPDGTGHIVIGHVIFKNSGHLPAREFKWYVRTDQCQSDRWQPPQIPDIGAFEKETVIAPGGTMKYWHGPNHAE